MSLLLTGKRLHKSEFDHAVGSIKPLFTVIAKEIHNYAHLLRRTDYGGIVNLGGALDFAIVAAQAIGATSRWTGEISAALLADQLFTPFNRF